MRKRIVLSLMVLPILLFMTACLQNNPIALKYTLKVSVTGQGAVSPNYDQFIQGTLVALEIRPAQGWKFSRWEGNNRYDVSGSQNSWRILMNGNKSLTAVFESEGGDGDPSNKHSLNITALGQGNVSPSSGTFQDGQLVDLEVRPGNGWVFDRWEGPNKNDVTTSGGRYSIRMNSNKSLLAVFAQNQRNLDITIEGKGKVEEKLLGSEYAHDSIVELTAVPDSGWTFKEWRGDASGTGSQTSVKVFRDMKVTAVFVQRHTLNVNIQGSGTVTKSPDSRDYEDGARVILTANPASGWKFAGWSGDASGSGNSVTITMNASKNVTAIFEQNPTYTLKIVPSSTAGGTIRNSPNKGAYDQGEVVTVSVRLTSIAWSVTHWVINGQTINSTATSQRVTMTQNTTGTVYLYFDTWR